MNHSAEQLPNAPESGATGVVEAGDRERVDATRRRALLRAAVAGAPMLVGVSPAGANGAAGSAYRAAKKDLETTQGLSSGEIAGTTTWFGKVVEKGKLVVGGQTYNNVYKLPNCTKYYEADGTSHTLGGPPDAFTKESDVFVLGLFDSSTYGALGLWPQVKIVPGVQGLHASAWSSIRPGASDPIFPCTGG